MQGKAGADKEEEREYGGVILCAPNGHPRLDCSGREQHADDGEDKPTVFGEERTDSPGRAIAEEPEERKGGDAECAGQNCIERILEGRLEGGEAKSSCRTMCSCLLYTSPVRSRYKSP